MKTIGELCDTHGKHVSQGGKDPFYITCLLYTSDAADE